MTDLSNFPVTHKWPAAQPERLQLYSMPTPNGVKAAIMLEEVGMPYEAHRVAFDKNEQHSPEYLSLNPNNKIPAIVDPNGSAGQPLPLFESGAILLYLAEKSGQLLPQDPVQRMQTIQWLMFGIGGVGPAFGQVAFFHKFAGKDWEDKRPRDRAVDEAKRQLRVLDGVLKGRTWTVGDEYTIADIAIFPWVNALVNMLGAGELVGFADFPEVDRALQAFLARPAVQRGLKVPS